MIVRLNGSSRQLITQPDHAALAARVMREWRADGLLESRLHAILLAVEEHDHGWLEVDAAPLVDAVTGRVLDFIGAPDDVRRSVWPRGVNRLAAWPYAAALVAQHALHIYRRYRDNPGWAPFFTRNGNARQRRLQPPLRCRSKTWSGSISFSASGTWSSLTFCNGWTEAQLDDSGSGYAIRLEGTRLRIAPIRSKDGRSRSKSPLANCPTGRFTRRPMPGTRGRRLH